MSLGVIQKRIKDKAQFIDMVAISFYEHFHLLEKN